MYFKDMGEFISVEIHDNGIGLKNSNVLSNRGGSIYQSEGLKMIQGSLMRINNMKELESCFRLETIQEDGKIKGTKVFLRIPKLLSNED